MFFNKLKELKKLEKEEKKLKEKVKKEAREASMRLRLAKQRRDIDTQKAKLRKLKGVSQRKYLTPEQKEKTLKAAKATWGFIKKIAEEPPKGQRKRPKKTIKKPRRRERRKRRTVKRR